MAVEADALLEQVGAHAVHHAHHDDERRDAQHHRDETERRGDEDEPFAPLRQHIAFEDGAFVRTQEPEGLGFLDAAETADYPPLSRADAPLAMVCRAPHSLRTLTNICVRTPPTRCTTHPN